MSETVHSSTVRSKSSPRETTARVPRFYEERAGIHVASAIPQPDVQPDVHPTSRPHAAAELAHAAIRLPLAVWGAVDILLGIFSVRLAHDLSPFSTSAVRYDMGAVELTYAVFAFISCYVLGVYARDGFNNHVGMISRVVGANILAVIGLNLAMTFVAYVQIGRYVLIISLLLSACAASATRLLVGSVAATQKRRIVFLGEPARLQRLVAELTKRYGRIYDDPAVVVPSDSRDLTIQRLRGAVATMRPHEIIVDDDTDLIVDIVGRAAELIASGARIRTLAAFYEELLEQVPVDTVDHRALVAGGFGVGTYGTEYMKRGSDFVTALIGVIVTLPIMLLVAAAVRITGGRGPILYSQQRVGRYGHVFTIYKFRTMRLDAEANGAQFAAANDPRVTRVGRLLRKLRLDELPQFWNVLRGDMSLVGPRPERPEFVAEFEKTIPYYQLRHLVPPGLTGWAQICYPYGSSAEDAQRKLGYDLYYVRHYGGLFDCGVLLRTIISLARGSR